MIQLATHVLDLLSRILPFGLVIFFLCGNYREVFLAQQKNSSCPLLRDAATMKVNMSGTSRARTALLIVHEQQGNECYYYICSTCRRVGRLGKAKLGPVGHKIYRTLNENATSLQHDMSTGIYFILMIDYIYNQQGS